MEQGIEMNDDKILHMNENEVSDREDLYLYENGVQKNKAEIQDAEEFSRYTKQYLAKKVEELAERRVKGKYNFDHLCRIHKAIFGEIYSWAGIPRTIDISGRKDSLQNWPVEFSHYENIEIDIKAILEDMNRKKRKKMSMAERMAHHQLICRDSSKNWEEMSIAERIEDFSRCMALLWKVHPFRAGNTATMIVFCCDFAEAHGFGIDRDYFVRHIEDIQKSLAEAAIRINGIENTVYLRHFMKLGMDRWEEQRKLQENAIPTRTRRAWSAHVKSARTERPIRNGTEEEILK